MPTTSTTFTLHIRGQVPSSVCRCTRHGAPVVEPEAGVTPHAVLCFAPAADVRGALKLFGAVPDLGALALGPPPGLECRTAEGLPLLALGQVAALILARRHLSVAAALATAVLAVLLGLAGGTLALW